MCDSFYKEIVDKILEDMCELVPIAGDPEASVANCEDGLRDLLEIRGVVNAHIRATRRELERRKIAGNPAEDSKLTRSGLPAKLVEFIEQRRQMPLPSGHLRLLSARKTVK